MGSSGVEDMNANVYVEKGHEWKGLSSAILDILAALWVSPGQHRPDS